MNKILGAFLILLIFVTQIIFANAKNQDTYINTSNISYDEKNNIIELSKDSKINFGNTNILVDRGIIDYNNNKIEIFGNFYLYQELNILSGKDLIGDTKLKNFTANNVSYIYNNDLKIDSDKAKKTDNNLIFYNNFLTPCELKGYFDCPTWSLRIDKTEYNIDRDKFEHFDTFLQIADYKIFYLPYFSHYGAKAKRQSGFLTPSMEFSLNGNIAIKTPYYVPLNSKTDITLSPSWVFTENFEFLKNYNLNTEINQKTSGGISEITIDNVKKEDNNNVNTSIKFNTKQVLSKNTIFSSNGLLTNSISTTRSINKKPLTYEDIYIKVENYENLSKKDYLKGEISTVGSFDTSNMNQIPLSPTIYYHNSYKISDKTTLLTNIDYRILRRDSSTSINPSESHTININNYYLFNKNKGMINSYNKISYLNSLSNYGFEHNSTLDRQENISSLILSSDIFFNINSFSRPRAKFIIFQEFSQSKNLINEDSNSIGFNYVNQYSDNRFFGNDMADNTSRIVYGLENNFYVFDQRYRLNINQSYNLKKQNNYSSKINQVTNLSDYSIEMKTFYSDIDFKIDLRIDENSYSRKEMNYLLSIYNPIQLSLNYHETDSEAYKNLSNNTKSLGLKVDKQINDNLILSYKSDLDLKNNYSPYSNSLTLSLFDECSKLEIAYNDTRFNDNYNTTPKESLNLSFYMDYLAFFNNKQKSNLFDKEMLSN